MKLAGSIKNRILRIDLAQIKEKIDNYKDLWLIGSIVRNSNKNDNRRGAGEVFEGGEERGGERIEISLFCCK